MAMAPMRLELGEQSSMTLPAQAGAGAGRKATKVPLRMRSPLELAAPGVIRTLRTRRTRPKASPFTVLCGSSTR